MYSTFNLETMLLLSEEKLLQKQTLIKISGLKICLKINSKYTPIPISLES
jgi:hypothetical protein